MKSGASDRAKKKRDAKSSNTKKNLDKYCQVPSDVNINFPFVRKQNAFKPTNGLPVSIVIKTGSRSHQLFINRVLLAIKKERKKI